MSQSMYSQRNSSERESGAHRATSVHNLDKSVNEEGETDLMTQSYYNPSSSAHRRRTDLMPTITFSNASPASGISRASTPGTRMLTRSPGKAQSMSRLDALSKPRPLFTKHDPVATPTSTSKFSGTPKRQNVLQSKNSPSPNA